MAPREIPPSLRRHEWRLDALDEWRRSVDERLSALEAGVRELVNADKIAAAVANAMHDQVLETRNVSLTRWQRAGAWTAVAVAAIGAAGGWAALIVHVTTGGRL